MEQINSMTAKPTKGKAKKPKRGRPKVARPMRRVNMSVYPDDYEIIERMAEENGLSAGMVMRLAMREFIERRRGAKLLAVKLGPRKGK